MEATEQLILFTEAFLNEGPVKICPSPASRPVYRESVPDSGTKCSGWCGKYGPVGSWLKMFVERSISRSTQYAPVWRLKDTLSGRSCFLLLRLERRTGESGCSSSRQEKMWPTPSTMDYIIRKGMRPSRAVTGRTTGYLSEAIVVHCGLRPASTETTTAAD